MDHQHQSKRQSNAKGLTLRSSKRARAQQIVAGEPRLRVLHQVFILFGCRDSRRHVNSTVMRFNAGVCERAKVENKYAEKNIRTLLLCLPVFFSK
jgi:hypothetical protein